MLWLTVKAVFLETFERSRHVIHSVLLILRLSMIVLQLPLDVYHLGPVVLLNVGAEPVEHKRRRLIPDQIHLV